MEQILQQFILPVVDSILEGGVSSQKDLYDLFRGATGSNCSAKQFKEWLSDLGYKLETQRLVVVPPNANLRSQARLSAARAVPPTLARPATPARVPPWLKKEPPSSPPPQDVPGNEPTDEGDPLFSLVPKIDDYPKESQVLPTPTQMQSQPL